MKTELLMPLALTAFIAIQVVMGILWLVSLRIRDASIVDGFWGPGFVVVAWLATLLTSNWSLHQVALATLVSAWGMRLAWHIFSRNHGQGEDYRYAAWRDGAGRNFWWISYFKVFLLQGSLIVIIGLPLLLHATGAALHSAWFWPGLAIAIVGMAVESVADLQLRRFRANRANQGAVLQLGLWRYSRHPNYFGDSLVWWGIAICALGVPDGWIGLVSPVLMTWFLTRVSGVPLLENRLIETKPGYADYARRTSSFLPWPPKKSRPVANAVVATGIAVALAAATAPGNANATASVRQIDTDTLVLRGQATYRHWGLIKVFSISLYAPPDTDEVYPLGGSAKLLELTYHVAIDAEDFAAVTHDGIRQVVGTSGHESLLPQIDAFNRLYRDVQAGDRYALAYRPARGTTLYLNDTPLGTVTGQEFARALFGIWLSERGMDARLRQRLLGGDIAWRQTP